MKSVCQREDSLLLQGTCPHVDSLHCLVWEQSMHLPVTASAAAEERRSPLTGAQVIKA